MPNAKRPRVAAIGLDDPQLESIEAMCGILRPADSLGRYLQSYNWAETDGMVSASGLWGDLVEVSINLLTIGTNSLEWSDQYSTGRRWHRHSANTAKENTERELRVPDACPDEYKPLAKELARQLSEAPDPPAVINTSRKEGAALIETTSGFPVAMRLVLPNKSGGEDDRPKRSIALLLPETASLVPWFRAFLSDIHELDPDRVPLAPPRLSHPADWYTPEEQALADRLGEIEREIQCLSDEREQRLAELAATGERVDTGIRRVFWEDGEELVAAASDILTRLGFVVRDMDAEIEEGDAKREDLRLTLPGVSGWEAIVEVKGYTSGTRTNDARQIREHRERYIREEKGPPNLTVWLSNPFRTTADPSSRPAPGQNLHEAAENIGAVVVSAPDLYKQWARVAAGDLDAESVVRSLKAAEPGLWTPPTSASGV